MNLQTSKVFYIGLIVLFLSIISVSVYFLLGGFNEARLYEAGPVDRTLFGKYFEDIRGNEFPEHGSKCRDLIESGAMQGSLTVMIYPNDTLRDTQIARFVGVSTMEEMSEIPADFEIRELSSGRRIVLEIKDMHLLVQPRPDKIENRMREFASSKGYELEPFYLIMYGQDDSETTIEWWVKD